MPTAAESSALRLWRLDHIASIMRKADWRRGVTARALADEWCIALPTVEGIAAEASRIVRAELSNPDTTRTLVFSTMEQAIHDLRKAGDHRGAAKVAIELMRMLGLDAPRRVEVTEHKEMQALSEDELAAIVDEARLAAH